MPYAWEPSPARIADADEALPRTRREQIMRRAIHAAVETVVS